MRSAGPSLYPRQPASPRPPALGCGVCGNRERMVRLSLAQEGTKLLEDWLDEIRWECGHGAYSFYSGSLEDCPDDGVSVPASHTETLPINGSFKRRAFFGFSYPKKARTRACARSCCEELAPLLFTEDYVPQVWPPVLWLRLFPTSILFALLRTLLAEVAAQLRKLEGVMQAIAQPRLDASVASLAVGP